MTDSGVALDTCGCCDQSLPQAQHANPPAQSVLSYRIGTHASFLRRMLARLPLEPVPDGPHQSQRPLARLTTREVSDLTIALLDAWAVAADVLTFYQERIANEGFLRTAVERRSVMEMARAIGYELSPGVAAQALVAFTLETAEGAPKLVQVEERTRIQSVPAPGKLPQTFETTESLEARPEWNAMIAQSLEVQSIEMDQEALYLRGTATRLNPGDFVLIVGDERLVQSGSEQWDVRRVLRVETDVKNDWTRIVWDRGLGSHMPKSFPTSTHPRIFAFRLRASFFGHNAPDWKGLPTVVQQAYIGNTTDAIPPDWPGFDVPVGQPWLVELDQAYPAILPGGWLALKTPESGLGRDRQAYVELYRVDSSSTGGQSGFAVTSKTTRVVLDTGENLAKFAKGRRDTLVLAATEELEIAQAPIMMPLQGLEVPVAGLVTALPPNRIVIITGRRFRAVVAETALPMTIQDAQGRTAPAVAGDVLFVTSPTESEGGDLLRWHVRDGNGFEGVLAAHRSDVRMVHAEETDLTLSEPGVIASVTSDTKRTTLHLAKALENAYDPASVRVLGNVALATHGETVEEVLGSGDAGAGGQQFVLHKPPLTFVTAANPRGSSSTLETRVSGVLWKEASSLFGAGTKDEVYAVRLDDSGVPSLTFGDAVQGARLPTGQDNVKVRYRSGIGPDGEVPAGALTMLLTRPQGVRASTNPLPATGSASPERLEDARRNAPRTVLTLDRVVSIQDHEDFARSFAGVGKARAAELWNGETRLVYLTVAPDGGRADALDADRTEDLRLAIEGARDPGGELRIGGFDRVLFRLSLGVRLDPRYDLDTVYAAVRSALEDAFSFDQRELGQHVTTAEVVAVVQAVPGVEAVDLAKLYARDDPNGPSQTVPPPVLAARLTRLVDETLESAQLLLLDPDPSGVEIHEMVVAL